MQPDAVQLGSSRASNRAPAWYTYWRCEADRVKYVLRNHCHTWERDTKKNFYQETIFPQKSSHINVTFKISV